MTSTPIHPDTARRTVRLDDATWNGLAADLDGRLDLPDTADWPTVAQAWNLSIVQRPAAVVTAANTADVVKAVRFAAAHRIRVSAQPSGHGATRALDDTILVRTTALDDIWIDTAARTARVGAGVKWGALQAALDGTGLTGLVGSNPDVSVVGFCLGGGLSWLTRPYGPGSGSLSAVELVDAQGVHRWVSDDESPELMWALRGGGGEFGIVTAVEIDLFPAPEITGGRLAFPAAEARSVLRAVAALTAAAPAELTVWASIMHFPPIPDLPEEIRGQSFCFVDALLLGPADALAAHLAPIRAAGAVLRDTVRPLQPSELGGVCEEPVDPSPGVHSSMMLEALDDAVVDLVLDRAGTPGATPLTQVQFRHLGGPARTGRTGAVDLRRDGAEFAVMTLTLAPVPELLDAGAAAMADLFDELSPWSAGPTVPTMLGPGESPERAYDERTLAALRRLKQAVDPAYVVRGNYPLHGR
ncbi:FAD-binding oxidoreductase [Prescottella agglutinans]|uniref:FAD-binding oxidoreductase n=1 Tax=Prescottella agglutinans TaxID=1644129 RepID=A0A438BHB0_9NOCA|nr:FAD-binding oxidoreductase [Prescottella agglutinans]RVW10460.1 FAD-binding oxidoreductase [Prescottella agglutinans]